MSASDFVWWRENSTTLSHFAMMWNESRTLATADGSRQLYGQSVSPALFTMRGVQPLLGRGLVADDERADSDVVAISPAGIGTPRARRISFAWYSWMFTVDRVES